eukprot:CAMPEP_0167755212 /NCGR_PEP_ID=MMETSP0110_2-20121227/8698_1 /TAXON_ID=629695 /ORGANISM="Gymnochlora sp., Strain CCMP2014" /LENGTH=497 /DNA_ID=CAMNT_0007641173 /DNA_START=99 /DNA_END=1592 /DNA_ORIENTATION=-
MTSDDVLKKSVAVEATDVARHFVKIYYTTSGEDPKKTHRFYLEDSKFTRFEDGKEPKIVVGQPNIYKVLETISYEKIIVDNVDSQGTINGGVLIVVTGRLLVSGKGSELQDFVQTFVLGQRGSQQGKTRQFYVCNDILRYLPRTSAAPSGKSEEATFAQAKEENEKTATSISEGKAKAQPVQPVSEQKQSSLENNKTEQKAKAVVEKAPPTEAKKLESKSTVKPELKPKETVKTPSPTPTPVETSKGETPEEKSAPVQESVEAQSKAAAADKADAKKATAPTPAPSSENAKEKPAAKEGTWAMRMRVSAKQPATAAPAPAPAANTQPSKPAVTKPNEKTSGKGSAKGDSDGKRKTNKNRGQRSNKKGFNYNDPENIALTLYVSNLPAGVGKEDIERKFSEFGSIREIQIPHPDHKYCFVHYAEKESVEAAIKARPVKLNGEDLKVDKRRPSNRNKGVEHGRGRGRGRGRHYRHAGRGDSKRSDGSKRGKRGRDTRGG